MQHVGFYRCFSEVFSIGTKANRRSGVSLGPQSSVDTVQNCSETVEEILHLVSRTAETLHSGLELWDFMDRETVLKAVEPSAAVAIIGTPGCPGLLFMPSNRVAVLEIKISNEPVCTRKKTVCSELEG